MADRHSDAPEDLIFIGATLQGRRASEEEVLARMAEIRAARESTQPIREMTGGSTFANPSQGHAKVPEALGLKAWQLIDRAGCRGMRVGGAQMSEKHCNFMINTGDATAEDLERLGEEVRKRVFEETNVRLRWEIRRLGVPAPGSQLDIDSPVMGAA